jgi:hypothetical protein
MGEREESWGERTTNNSAVFFIASCFNTRSTACAVVSGTCRVSSWPRISLVPKMSSMVEDCRKQPTLWQLFIPLHSRNLQHSYPSVRCAKKKGSEKEWYAKRTCSTIAVKDRIQFRQHMNLVNTCLQPDLLLLF